MQKKSERLLARLTACAYFDCMTRVTRILSFRRMLSNAEVLES